MSAQQFSSHSATKMVRQKLLSYVVSFNIRISAIFAGQFVVAALNTVGRVAQSVQRLATGWTVRGSNPGGGEIFRTSPNRLWGPPSLLYNGYWVFPGGKQLPGRDADPSPPSSAVVKKEQSYTSTPPKGRTVCTEPQCLTRVHFTFLLYPIPNCTKLTNENTNHGQKNRIHSCSKYGFSMHRFSRKSNCSATMCMNLLQRVSSKWVQKCGKYGLEFIYTLSK